MSIFDKQVNRRGTSCVKWDKIKEEGVIPLWVADMDFEAAPAIRQALEKRIQHGIFGYVEVDDDYYNAIIGWQKRRHQWNIRREWIQSIPGVVPGISCAIKALTLPGEKVLILTPVYNCFFSSIRNQGCEIAESKLIRKGDSYVINWDDFERQCRDEKTTVFLLCNPHNPAGRVWTREELRKMGDICLRNNVRIISDEIHCELTMPGYTFTPFAATSEENQKNSVTLNAPSKAFNIAGLQNAYIVCSDKETQRRINRVINIYEVCDINPLGVTALKAAYNESEAWLDELIVYIWDNYRFLKNYFAEYLPQVDVIELQGTYLAWVDIRKLGLSSDETQTKLLHEGKVFVNSGTLYGKQSGEGYLRINLACPRATLEEGLRRMVTVLKQ